jgi:hypothetical protein
MSTFKAYRITPAAGPIEYDTVRDRAKARARELGGTSEEVELPATKGGLIPFLNAREAEIAALAPAAADWREEVIAEPNGQPSEPEPAPRPSPAPVVIPAPPARDLTVDAIEEAIGEARGAPFGRYLSAAVARLGELGRDGWAEFQAFRNFTRDAERNEARQKRPYAAAFDERGLRLLALAQIQYLDDGRAG